MDLVNIIRGTYYGPVVSSITFRNGGTVTISSAIVRLSRDGKGVLDCTVANGFVSVNDTDKTVTWHIPQEKTALLEPFRHTVEIILIDPQGQQRIPAEGGKGDVLVESRASAPA